jgi:hypothetical protein
MYIKSALVAGCCLALETSAFLVPLEVSNAVEEARTELASLLASGGHTIDLDCPGCPYLGVDDVVEDYDEEIGTKIVSTCSCLRPRTRADVRFYHST